MSQSSHWNFDVLARLCSSSPSTDVHGVPLTA
jgi:hypothetical protein